MTQAKKLMGSQRQKRLHWWCIIHNTYHSARHCHQVAPMLYHAAVMPKLGQRAHADKLELDCWHLRLQSVDVRSVVDAMCSGAFFEFILLTRVEPAAKRHFLFPRPPLLHHRHHQQHRSTQTRRREVLARPQVVAANDVKSKRDAISGCRDISAPPKVYTRGLTTMESPVRIMPP